MRLRKRKQEVVVEQFEKLAQESYNRLFRSAYYFAGNYEDAQDIVQETFTISFRAFDSFNGKSTFYTWLYSIFRKVLSRYFKQTRASISKDGSLLDEENELENIAAPQNPYTLIIESEKYQAVHDNLQAMPEIYREVLLLRHFEDFSYAEIAQIMECSVGAVKSRIFKAREILRRKLG